MLNSNRVNGLIKMGAIDAEMNRKNMEAYGKNLTFQENFNAQQGTIGRQMAYKEATRKSSLYGKLGSELIGSAISDIAFKEQSKAMGPYMNSLVQQAGLQTTLSRTQSDIMDDASSFLNLGADNKEQKN